MSESISEELIRRARIRLKELESDMEKYVKLKEEYARLKAMIDGYDGKIDPFSGLFGPNFWDTRSK